MDVLSISLESLYPSLGVASAPLLVDVRRGAAFDADKTMIAGAIRRRPEYVSTWLDEWPPGHRIVAYWAHGHEAGLPTRRKHGTAPSTWVTRERPKIGRIACPGLIRRFVYDALYSWSRGLQAERHNRKQPA